MDNMNQRKTQLDRLLTPDQKQETINNLIAFFDKDRSEKIGVLAAEEILDEILDSVGNTIYNKGVEEAKKIIAEHLQSLEVDIDLAKHD